MAATTQYDSSIEFPAAMEKSYSVIATTAITSTDSAPSSETTHDRTRTFENIRDTFACWIALVVVFPASVVISTILLPIDDKHFPRYYLALFFSALLTLAGYYYDRSTNRVNVDTSSSAEQCLEMLDTCFEKRHHRHKTTFCGISEPREQYVRCEEPLFDTEKGQSAWPTMEWWAEALHPKETKTESKAEEETVESSKAENSS
ncbi:hypothetical protein VTL71DRAFT_13843 [Oculimacula yallundae]|uniref:Uncharacterized protein n=1 Tax=Oculimacula yallundae TaxID=86028 RepID=A0ABR4CMT5_9HELO